VQQTAKQIAEQIASTYPAPPILPGRYHPDGSWIDTGADYSNGLVRD